MRKQVTRYLLTIIMILSIFAGCTNDNSSTAEQDHTNIFQQTQIATSVQNDKSSEIAQIQVEYSDTDQDSTYSKSNATIITLSNDSTQINGNGASFSESTLNISNAGTYIISGELDGQIVVDATIVDTVQLVLDNTTITNNTGPAIYVTQAEKVIITLAEGSKNIISDDNDYANTTDDAPDAAIYADDDLTINGKGILIVNGNYKHGIKSSDNLIIISGTLNITAHNDALRGKDSVAILDGNIKIDAGGDGIKSTNNEDEEQGWILIDGGTFEISATSNGIQTSSALVINAGTVAIESTEDSLHCNGNISITDGTFTLDAGDDGIHADGSLVVSGGTIKVTNSYEGLEGADISICGGEIFVRADDDGLNAAGGSDDEMDMGKRPMDNFNSGGDYFIDISDGYVYINADGDGIDSNGSIYISGGTIIVDGPSSNGNSAIDMENSTFAITGGIIIAVGSSQMLVNPTNAQQNVLTIIYNHTQNTGDIISLMQSENPIIEFTPAKSYQSIIISSPALNIGDTYTLLSNISELTDVTLTDTITTISDNGDSLQISGMNRTGGMPQGRGDRGDH